jgi:acyl-CoA synthetase (AMP-forming)/AMP-acid ligase II
MASVVLPTLDPATLPASLSHLLTAAAEELPNSCAVVGDEHGANITFAQLKDAAVSLAAHLFWEVQQQQLEHACIGILLSDSPLFMLAPCACSYAAQPFCFLGRLLPPLFLSQV